jgi:hypothetical protein
LTGRRGRSLARAARGQHSLIPRAFDLSASAPLVPASVHLTSRFTVVAGLNGAGKSKLLAALAIELGAAARLIEVHGLASWLRTELSGRHDLPELAEEADDLVVDEKVLSAVREVVRRDYDWIEWYALALEDSPFAAVVGEDVIPYFVVQYGGVRYSMLDMGSGELAAHVLLWTLWYLRDAHDAALLLDEPDAFLPPDSREILLDRIAELSLRQQQAVVVATHSAELIAPAAQQDGSLLFLLREPSGVQCYSTADDVAALTREYLYKDPRLALVAFVEDPAAAALATELLKALDPLLFRMTALFWGAGVGGLEALARHLPRPERPPRDLEFLLIADSDQPQLLGSNTPTRWPFALLPGNGSEPDELFIQAAYASPTSLAGALGKSEAGLKGLIDRIRGAEPHDWTDEFVAGADVDRPAALRALARACVDGPDGAELVESFRSALTATGLRAFAEL